MRQSSNSVGSGDVNKLRLPFELSERFRKDWPLKEHPGVYWLLNSEFVMMLWGLSFSMCMLYAAIVWDEIKYSWPVGSVSYGIGIHGYTLAIFPFTTSG